MQTIEQAPASAVLDRIGLAILLNRSVTSIDRDLALGRIPAGVYVGRSRRFLRSEIMAWLEAGCPHRDEWGRRKKAASS